MRRLKYYSDLGLRTDDEIFQYLLSTLRPGVTDWDYFVDWDKVFQNTRELEVLLNIFNYLIGKDNFEAEFKYLASRNPEIIKAIPTLIVRNGQNSSKYHVVSVNDERLNELKFDFGKNNPSEQDIQDAADFIKQTGLIKIFKDDGVKNLVDYVIGVEAGLNSNGRKNRSGTAMENISESLLINMGCDYIRQAKSADIERRYGIMLNAFEGRIFDFAVLGENGLNIIEVNCYSSGGSKLDKTASDYRSLQDELRGQATFIWFTDGAGWAKTKKPLRKSFTHNDYILNLHMVQNGALKEIFDTPTS